MGCTRPNQGRILQQLWENFRGYLLWAKIITSSSAHLHHAILQRTLSSVCSSFRRIDLKLVPAPPAKPEFSAKRSESAIERIRALTEILQYFLVRVAEVEFAVTVGKTGPTTMGIANILAVDPYLSLKFNGVVPRDRNVGFRRSHYPNPDSQLRLKTSLRSTDLPLTGRRT